jgi:gliding motility-associatede transport system auxiliary component
MKRRNALLTTNALVSAVLVAALLVALNYLGTVHHVRWDLTATREHSLSPQTIKVLRSLPGPIDAVAFPNGDGAGRYRDMLGTYQYYSKNFQYRIVDPDRNPQEAQKFKVTSYGQIVLSRGKASYTIDSDTEEQLTNGILHVLETTKKAVYVLQGEGEVPVDDFTRKGMGTAKQTLAGKGFDVKTLFLVQTGRVPDDAAIVIVPAPSRDLLPQVRDALERYYQGGGKLLIMVDPPTPPEVRSWLGPVFHVDAPGGVVIDPVSRLLGGDFAVPIVTQYPFNDITQNFTLATAFPVSTPLVPQAKVTGVTITPVVKSSDSSYVKVNLESKNIRFEQGTDVKGPVILAVEVTPAPGGASAGGTTSAGTTSGGPAAPAGPAKPAGAKGSAVIIGNSGFVQNTYIGLVGNRDLFTSAVAWLTQTGNLVSIAPRTSPFDPFIIGGNQGRYLFLGSVIGVPLVLLLIGGAVYARRRSL